MTGRCASRGRAMRSLRLPAVASGRYLLRHPWQLVLAVLGIALGVAVVIAVDVAGDSAKRAFELSAKTLTGHATHAIYGGPRGVPEAFYRALRIAHGMRAAAPVVEATVTLNGPPDRAVRLIGLDLFADGAVRDLTGERAAASDINRFLTQPGSGMLLADTAADIGVAIGDAVMLRIAGHETRLTIAGLLRPRQQSARHALASVVLVDIATAQELLGRAGWLSRIDLVIPDGAAGAQPLARIQAALPPGLTLVESAARLEGLQQMTRAFHLNLAALGLLALIVGVFLIYNTMTFSVVQRRTLIGMVRALGVTRREIFAMVLIEALLIGIAGTLAGVLLGVALGNGLVHFVTRTINDLYFVVTVRELSLGAATLVKGLLLGVGGSLLAALAPAHEATTTPPRAVLTRSDIETRLRRFLPRVTVLGVLLMGAGVLLVTGDDSGLLMIYGGILLGIGGAALLVSPATVVLLYLLAPVVARLSGLPGRMAARGIVASLSRSGIAIAALAVAVAATIGMGVMTGSFRATVDQWLTGYLRADIYVTPAGDGGGVLEPAVIDTLRAADGVAAVSTGRYVQLESAGERIALMALELPPQALPAFTFKQGVPEQVWPMFQAHDAVIVTEPFAWHRHLAAGDRIVLPTDRGEHAFDIAGVFYHYGSDRGLVMMSRATYDRYWNDPAIGTLGIYAAPGVAPDALRTRLLQHDPAAQSLTLQLGSELHDISLEVFDRTFLITSVLRLLAIVVAFVGILSALMALQLERSRELAVLRAIGLTPAQLWQLVMTQTGLMGLVAGLLAIPCGLLLSVVLVHVVNLRSFGWTMQLIVSPAVLAQALVLAVVAALLAGIYPARRMMRTSPALALRND
ncbi:MAG: putative ABC transport system permease protein [Gammaproteobacteria bacterium]|nr:MAG: putative ABC transport system permease protein [Gammaproteobacteria bacterium]TND05759.1 MAG: putative ABC transport system permease protein [Gammaproteobacteria bacterium]